MSVSERLGIPSPDECVGVVGLVVSLVGVTVGVVALLVFSEELAVVAVIIASLLLGWVSVLYCVVWGESRT